MTLVPPSSTDAASVDMDLPPPATCTTSSASPTRPSLLPASVPHHLVQTASDDKESEPLMSVASLPSRRTATRDKESSPTSHCSTQRANNTVSTTTRRWTEDEVAGLLEYWSDHIQDYKTKKKAVFYRHAAGLPALARKSEEQVRSKCNDIDNRYKSMHLKLSTTGFGVDGDEQRTLRAWVESKFPLYYKVDSFYSGRSSVDPPVVFESGETSISQLAASCHRSEEGEEDHDSLVRQEPIGNSNGSPRSSLWSNYESDHDYPNEEVSIELTQPSASSNTSQPRSVELQPTSEINLTTTTSTHVTSLRTMSSTEACASTSFQPLTSNDVIASCTSATDQTRHRSCGKRTAAETLSDSLAALGEQHIAFQREKLVRTLEFERNKFEKMLELENKKVALTMQMHQDEMRATQQHHDEVMQLRQAKLEAMLSTLNHTPKNQEQGTSHSQTSSSH